MVVARVGTDGDGVAVLPDGAPLYLAGTLPGESVAAEVTGRRGEGWAGTAEIIVASPERVAPPCPHFGACGGCAVQHWRDDSYAAWKSGLVAAALRRAGFGEVAMADMARTPPGARRRADLAIARQGNEVVVGLHAARGTAVVGIAGCLVLDAALVALLGPLRDVLRRLGALRRAGSAVVNLMENGADLLLRLDGVVSAGDRGVLAAFAAAQGVARISVALGNGVAETACLLRAPVLRFQGVEVAPPPGAFLQASREGEAAIVAAVLAGLPEKLGAKARVAELYAGCGTLSFALAAHAGVTAFEGDADAAAALRRAANAAGLAGRVEVAVRDLTRQPLTAKELGRFAAVVLDPPFAGAAAQIGAIAASRVARVIIVSCNPTALARDARTLREAGYRVLAAVPIDQFLWSARLESVVVFGI